MKSTRPSTFFTPLRKNNWFIRLDLTWLLVVPAGLWAIAVGYVSILGAFLSPAEIWLVAFITLIMVVLSLLGHARAHRWAARLLGSGQPERIPLLPFGDTAQSWPLASSPGKEALAALAGPLVSALLAALGYAAWNAQLHSYLNVSASFAAIFNAWLAGVNLTPVFPLDGGRLLRAIGWGWLKRPQSALRWGVRAGYLLAAGLVAWGTFLIAQNDRYSLETGGATVLFALLLAEGLKMHPAWRGIEESEPREAVRPGPAILSSLALLALAGVSATLLLTNNGVEAPGVALSVEPMIQVPAQYAHAHSGTFILTSVLTQSPVPAGGWLLSRLTPAVKLLPPEQKAPNQPSPQEAAEEGFQMLYQSEATALAVGMQMAGYPASVTGKGVQVVSILPESHANGVLKPGDVIVGLNGKPVRLIPDLTNPLQIRKPGDTVRLRVERNGQTFDYSVSLLAPSAPENPPVIGITVQSAGFDANLPIPAKIVSQKIVGGPSAGLMFTLGVYNSLTPQDLTRGRKIAGTGTINPDGTVGPIGGVEEKVVAAEQAGAEYFLSPPENYPDALSAARGIKVIQIATAQQAVDFLKSLPGQP